METIFHAISLFALLTGIPYMIFEVLQKNVMWYFGIATALASSFVFAMQMNWASLGLNIYYAVVSVWGLYQWKKDSAKLEAGNGSGEGIKIHLTRLSARMFMVSMICLAVFAALLVWLLDLLGDPNVVLDALSTSISILAMIWLAKSIPYHWCFWIVGDILLVIMCALQGNYWMAGMYSFYVAASVFGLFLWFRNGTYVDTAES